MKELGLETYPQYTVGKKVYHTGGPGAKVRSYTKNIPALSPLVVMDFMQMVWKVRIQNQNKSKINATMQRKGQ